MAEISDLRMRPSMRHAYLLLIEGCPFAFTDEQELADINWWQEDSRTIKLGLTVPENLILSLDLESGMLEEQQATFRLLDIDSTVPEFFGGQAKQYLGLGARLSPLDSPAPPTIDNYGQALLLNSAYVGTEAIGPEGERNFYSATPVWADMPGQDHPSKDDPLPVVTDSSTGPYLIEGRRVALYRMIYDPDTGGWPSFTKFVSAAVEAGRNPMLWWGTLRQSGKVDGRIWSITCTGVGSWLRRGLNTRTSVKWYPVTATFELADNEKHIGLVFNKRYYKDGHYINNASTYSTYLVDPSSKANIITSINTAITATAAAAGVDGVWTAVAAIGAGALEFTEDWIKISISLNLGYQANCKIILARKVWRALGYDPDAGVNNNDGPGPRFYPGASFEFIGANPDLFVEPLPSYYTAHITTCPEGEDPQGFTGEYGWAGSGQPRVYFPTYTAGVSVLSGSGNQIVSITPDDNEDIYCESQTIRAREDATAINGYSCNAQRLWLFRGQLQLPPANEFTEQPDPIDTVQVARCLWVEFDSGIVAEDGGGTTRGLYIKEWLDPRLFGLHYEPIDPALGWASNDGGAQIECSPLGHLGAYYKRPDRVDHTIIRTLLSTGTAVWDASEEDTSDANAKANAAASLTPGANDLTDQSWPCGDFEIYDLGLQIPKTMVDVANILGAAVDLEGGATGPLGQSKVSIQGGPLQSEELFKALFAPRGWAFSLKRGKIGIWAPHASPEAAFEDGVDFEIGEADLHGAAGDPGSAIPTVELRPVDPFDRLTWTHTGDPTAGWTDGQDELRFKARDVGARARSGMVNKDDFAAPDFIATSWFLEGDQKNPNNADTDLIKTWTAEVANLWEKLIPTWLAGAHRLIKGLRVSRPKGQDIYPGAILRLTNPWPANSEGTYGVSGSYARVVSVTHETDSCAAVVDCLLYATPPGAKRWAPIVRVKDTAATTADRYDVSTKTFYLQDWGGIAPPVQYFIKPDYIDEADDPACVYILQYDGVTWTHTGTAFVESANTLAKTLTLTSAGITGTFYERQYTVIVMAPAEYEDQVQWVRALFVQHTLFTAPDQSQKIPK